MNNDIEKAWQECSYNYETNDALSQIANKHRRLLFRAGYNAHKAQEGWIAIEDIPEEWKDGREIDLFSVSGQRYCNYRYFSDGGSVGDYWRKKVNCQEHHCIRNADLSHAMLPPSPPKETT